MINAHAYNITVRQIEADTQVLFEARVRELPDVVDFGETWEEAYGLAVDSIQTIAEIMAEQNRSMPEPAAIEDEYSGRVTLRVPKSLHRRLAEQAEFESISLNQYLVTLLAHGCGTTFEKSVTANNWWLAKAHEVQTHRRKTQLEVISSSNDQADGWLRIA